MRLRALFGGPFCRLLCVVLAATMATAPSANLLAQQPYEGPQQELEKPSVAEQPIAGDTDQRRPLQDQTLLAAPQAGKIDVSYVSPQAVAIATLRPQQLLRSPAAQSFPVEVATAAGLEYLGIDPADVEEVVAFAEPPLPGAMQYGLVVRLAKSLQRGGIKADLRAHTQPAELNGKKYLQSTQPMLPSFYMPDQQTLLVMPDATLRRVLEGQGQAQPGPLLDRVREVPGGSDLYAAVDVATLRPMINPLIGMAVAKQGDKFPEHYRPLLKAPDLISAAELTFNVSNDAPSSLVVQADDEASAEQLQSIVDQSLELAQGEMRAEIAEQLQSDDPIERAYGQYMQRISGQWADTLRPKLQGSTLTIFRTPEGGAADHQQLVNLAVVGVLVALLLPAVQAAREAARRNLSMNNMKQLLLSLFVYEDSHKSFPAHAIYSAEGKPLLSWRVQILPYIEEKALYDQFHLNEPWDSPHNKQLVALMPAIFQSPGFENQEGKTCYLAVVGKECVFDGSSKGMSLRNIRDGTSKTILMVEVDPDQAVEWTKPDDWQYDAKNPKAGLGAMRQGGWQAGWADGHVSIVSDSIDPQVINAAFTRDGKEVLDTNAF